jgi:tetratricopeptide (TPR) repeat protein
MLCDGMPDDSDLDQILDTALARHEAGQLDLAEAGYRSVLQRNPDEPDALNLLGLILQDRGDLAGSIGLITRALELVPNFAEALVNLARAQRAAGSPAAAVDAARRALALDPDLAEAHLQLGHALVGLGDNAGGVEALRQATVLAPRSAEAWLSLGAALMRLTQYDAAASSLAAALALDPDRADTKSNLALALVQLARAHRVAGDGQAAAEAARRAIVLDPALPDAQMELGLALLAQQEDAAAVDQLRCAIDLAPQSSEAQAALATALTRLKEHAAAAEVWLAALALSPDDPGILIEYAGSLGELKRFDEALTVYRTAEALAPANPRAKYGIALCLVCSGDIKAAVEVCRTAVETMPDWPALWLLLANCEAKLGHFTAAAAAYRRHMALAPGSADVMHDLVAVDERIEDDTVKDAARNTLGDDTKPARERFAAGFTLGKLNDRDGAYDEAFEAYALANQLRRADRAEHGLAFKRQKFSKLVDWLIATIGPQSFVRSEGWGDQSEVPVFIVGMPRSGTSLVEQIAASHPLVFGAGEQMGIPRLLAALSSTETDCSPATWDPAFVRRETTSYLQNLRALGGDAVRIIDKQPDNVLFLGQIAMLFPRARIVVCRRDLRDVGLSCFFQYFQDDMTMWADDLADCGFRARQVDRLMDHWRRVLPLPVLEIQYETLVANLETESRRLIDFLGLDWDPACLRFHETERAVATASRWQVRQPLYASSVGRWRHYRRHLQPLLAALAEPGPTEDNVQTADPTATLAAAMQHHRAGRFDQAEAIYRAVLRHDPDEPAALHLLGLLLLDRGEPAESVVLITRSLALRPGVALALTALARAHRACGNAEAAVEAARHAADLDPALPDAHRELGCALFAQQDYAGAIEPLRHATEMTPGSIEARTALAATLTRCKQYEAAAEAWQAALALKPDDPDVMVGFAGALADLERFDEGLAAYRQAEVLAPGNPRVQHGIARILARTGDIPGAAAMCRDALETTPDRPELWLLLGYCDAMHGHFDAAAEAYRRALALDPGSAGALHDLVAVGGQLDDDATKDAARQILRDQSRPVRDRVAAGFALARVNDRDGAYDEAFAAYALANRLLRAEHSEHGRAFDRNRFRELVDWLIATFTAETFVQTAGWGDRSDMPVFIVGMPRSGTSLVEQIVASHKLVFGGGEQSEIFGILTALGGERIARSPTEWDSAAVHRETVSYLQRLRGVGGDAARITDKLPDNIICLGQIAVLFPQARIVVCQRDPRDVGLSCFFQYFGEDSMAWTDDLADCGFRARQIDRLMEHWRKVLPIPVLEIQYETLVGNLEPESRRLINFLGLEWDPACLAFHETVRPVRTASYMQVRKPLYASSIGRWRQYEDHLGPLLAELQDLLPADADDSAQASL